MGKYKVLQKLGQGSYGTVFLVHDSKDGRLFVMKKITVSGMSANELVDCKREIQILAMLKHPNIIGYQRSFVRRGALCIVMDYADNGDLHRMIHKQRKVRKAGGPGFPETLVLDLLVQVALGLRHIHQHKILHRDLKTQNIFLTKDGGVRLGDFGISRVMASTMDQAKTLVGTPYYLSPEMVNGLPYDSKTDMWSLGVVLYEMLTLEHPFNADNLQMLALRIIQGNYPPVPTCYSEDIKGLLSSLLDQNPATRTSIDQCLAHPLLSARALRFSQPMASRLTPENSLAGVPFEDPQSTGSGNSSPSAGTSDQQLGVDSQCPAVRRKNLVRRGDGRGDGVTHTPAYPQQDVMVTDVNVQPPSLCESSTYQSERTAHQRTSSTIVHDPSMGPNSEPDWSGVQRPQHTESKIDTSYCAQPRKNNVAIESRAYQINILRGHLQSKLGDQLLNNLLDVLKSDSDDLIKTANVRKLIGSHQEVLPIVHTLLYLEQR
uniref:non-specific serine/threonine protein kinase n=1 Tax=Spongospora subterranea TaxID=70186 RepID=A0A0H5RL37_9EUKA|eukprot:CRZ09434.1 hypothetical protein [Spongospora subterranea]